MKTHHLTLNTSRSEHEAVLTLPEQPGPHPAILLIHGGGCTDVDCSVGPDDFPWARHLADRLCEHGIAMMRYYRSPSDSVDWDLEVAAAGWSTLTSHPAIDKQRCTILGHSEGSWQATLMVSTMREHPDFIRPQIIIETGIFGGELMDIAEAVFRAVDAPLMQIARSNAAADPTALRQYAEAWHMEFDEFIEDSGRVDAQKLVDYRNSILNEIRDMMPSNKRISSWLDYRTNAEAILDLADLPIALLVGTRDQETPPQQAQLVLEALEKSRPNHSARLYELAGHNHYLAVLSDAPLDTSFGPASEDAIALIARLTHGHQHQLPEG